MRLFKLSCRLKLLFSVLKQAGFFKVRRWRYSLGFLSFSQRKRVIRWVLVDIDGCLIDSESGVDMARIKCGHEQGQRICDEEIHSFLNGVKSLNEALLSGVERVIGHQITRKDWTDLFWHNKGAGRVRTPLVQALKALQAQGARIVLATRSSIHYARAVSDHFGWDGVIGTMDRMDEQGIAHSIQELIGTIKGYCKGTAISTKFDKLIELYGTEKDFHPRHVAVLSNDMMDAGEMKRSGLGILLLPRRLLSKMERGAQKFGLFDVRLRENRWLEKRLLFLLTHSHRSVAAYRRFLQQQRDA